MNSYRILPAGDSALLVELGQTISPQVSRRVHALAARWAELPLLGRGEAVPGYGSLLLHFDPLFLQPEEAANCLEHLLQGLPFDLPAPPGKILDVPVVYDGPDLLTLAASKRLSPAELIAIHSGQEYLVYLIGFTPGFAYLGEVDERIAAPRLPTPRTSVPAGSVGIAGRQTGVYPLASPGGWQLIGRTNLRFFDPTSSIPSLLAPGDTVRFFPVEVLP